MTQTEKEQYELTIKNMQSKIDWLRDQRKLLDTYGKKYEPLTDEQIDVLADKFTVKMGEMWEPELCIEFNDSCKSVHSFARAIEAAHGIKE